MNGEDGMNEKDECVIRRDSVCGRRGKDTEDLEDA